MIKRLSWIISGSEWESDLWMEHVAAHNALRLMCTLHYVDEKSSYLSMRNIYIAHNSFRFFPSRDQTATTGTTPAVEAPAAWSAFARDLWTFPGESRFMCRSLSACMQICLCVLCKQYFSRARGWFLFSLNISLWRIMNFMLACTRIWIFLQWSFGNFIVPSPPTPAAKLFVYLLICLSVALRFRRRMLVDKGSFKGVFCIKMWNGYCA